MNYKGILFAISISVMFSCKNRESNFIEGHDIQRDTINVEELVDDFNSRLDSTGIGVNIQFFNKRDKSISKLTANDTFLIKVAYESDLFTDLAKSHEIELEHAKGNFKFLGQESGNKFKLSIGESADTIEFDVFLKSKKYIFNDYFLEKGEINYELRDVIYLCKVTEVLFSK